MEIIKDERTIRKQELIRLLDKEKDEKQKSEYEKELSKINESLETEVNEFLNSESKKLADEKLNKPEVVIMKELKNKIWNKYKSILEESKELKAKLVANRTEKKETLKAKKLIKPMLKKEKEGKELTATEKATIKKLEENF